MSAASWWRRTFRGSDVASELVERVLEEQADFERQHPIPFRPELRAAAARARLARLAAGAPPRAAAELLERALADWDRARAAAEEVT